MKNNAIIWVWLTTAYLLVFTMLSQLNTPCMIMFGLLVAGQAMVLYMVFKVLKDKYTTNKTFRHWYEDRPVETLEKE